MTRIPVTLVDPGAGNIRSVTRALEHEGGVVLRTADPDVIRHADRIVVPGQGHFGRTMERIEANGIGDALREAVARGTPYLGICVGMQIMYEGSAEAEGRKGLGFLAGTVSRLPSLHPLPHVGWNRVTWEGASESPLLAGLADVPRYFYHVHSYAASGDPDETLGWSEYGTRFSTVAGRDRVFGVQFHPEKSQTDGLRLVRNFLTL